MKRYLATHWHTGTGRLNKKTTEIIEASSPERAHQIACGFWDTTSPKDIHIRDLETDALLISAGI